MAGSGIRARPVMAGSGLNGLTYPHQFSVDTIHFFRQIDGLIN